MDLDSLRSLLEEAPQVLPEVSQESVVVEPSAVKRWHTIFNDRLKQVYPNDSANQITRKLLPLLQEHLKSHEGGAYGLAEQIEGEDGLKEVKSWVVGKDIPRDIYTHQALMDVLNIHVHYKRFSFSDKDLTIIHAAEGLSKTKLRERFGNEGLAVMDRWKQVDAATHRMAKYRRHMSEEHGLACEEMGNAPRELGDCNGHHRNGGNGHAAPPVHLGGGVSEDKGTIFDAPYMPKRLIVSLHHGDILTYNSLTRKELQHIVDHTENCCELLRAWRLSQESESSGHHLSLATAAERLGISVSIPYEEREVGKTLPSKTYIEKAHDLFRNDKPAEMRFVELAIANRLAAYEYNTQIGDYKTASALLAGMPRMFWAEMLHKVNHDRAPGAEIPSWSHIVPDITTQGQYLRALRYVMEMTQDDVVKSIRQPSDTDVLVKWLSAVEYDEYARFTSVRERHDECRRRLVDFYEKRQTEGSTRTQWFKRDVFEGLSLPVNSVNPVIGAATGRESERDDALPAKDTGRA